MPLCRSACVHSSTSHSRVHSASDLQSGQMLAQAAAAAAAVIVPGSRERPLIQFPSAAFHIRIAVFATAAGSP